MSKEKLAFITVILTYFLIVFGGYVASSESGMGCGPEWPLCNGKIIPVLQGDTLIEFGHRVIGAVLFVFTVFLFRKLKKENNSKVENKAANWMLGLLALQLIMGAIVVFYHLPSFMITIHLQIAMIFLAILIWFWRFKGKDVKQKYFTHKNIVKHLNTLIILLFIVIGIGGYIKHQDYGLACGWLTCGNSILPTSIPEIMQSTHRVLALVSLLYTLFITYKILSANNNLLKSRMILALVVIIMQLIIGIITILSFIPLSLAVLHLAAGTLLFAIVVEARITLEN